MDLEVTGSTPVPPPQLSAGNRPGNESFHHEGPREVRVRSVGRHSVRCCQSDGSESQRKLTASPNVGGNAASARQAPTSAMQCADTAGMLEAGDRRQEQLTPTRDLSRAGHCDRADRTPAVFPLKQHSALECVIGERVTT